jgi:hypothetical protein
LIPTEIFPSNLRAQGNGFGITGWAIGVGWTVLVNPIMFDHLQNRTYFLFAGLNLLWIPIIYLFYPETKVSLEDLTRPKTPAEVRSQTGSIPGVHRDLVHAQVAVQLGRRKVVAGTCQWRYSRHG